MDINFIKPTAVINQEHQLKKWYYHSLILIMPIMLLILFISIMQILSWCHIKQENRSIRNSLSAHNQTTTEYQQLISQEKLLKKKLAKITKHLNNPADPSTLLKMVKVQLKDGSSLEHIAYAGQITQLAISADAKQIGQLCVALPHALSCKSLHMSSLEYQNNTVKAILKNTENKNKAT